MTIRMMRRCARNLKCFQTKNRIENQTSNKTTEVFVTPLPRTRRRHDAVGVIVDRLTMRHTF